MSEQSAETAQPRKTQHDLYVERQDPQRRFLGRHERVEKSGERCTLADYIRAAQEHRLDPTEVTVGPGWISWSSPESDAEVQRRIDAARQGAAKHLEAIKQMHDTYAAEGLYGALVIPPERTSP